MKNGIEVAIQSVEKWDKSGFAIDDDKVGHIWLPLLEKEVVFNVHRDLFQGVEWAVFMEDPKE